MSSNSNTNGSAPQSWSDPLLKDDYQSASSFPSSPPHGPLTQSSSPQSGRPRFYGWNRFRERISERTWFILLAFSGIVTLIALLLAGTAMRRQTVIQVDEGLEVLTLSQQTPAAIAGITPNTSPEVVYQRLSETLPEVSALVDELAKETLDGMLANEAHRIRAAAAAEVQAGVQVFVDPVSDINFESCYRTRSAFDCVLHRYAGDGLYDVATGLHHNDVYLVVSGFLKVKAAEMAFSPPPQVAVNKDLLYQALLNKRLGTYDMTGAMPGGQIPAIPLTESPLGEGLGTTTIIEENPPPLFGRD